MPYHLAEIQLNIPLIPTSFPLLLHIEPGLIRSPSLVFIIPGLLAFPLPLLPNHSWPSKSLSLGFPHPTPCLFLFFQSNLYMATKVIFMEFKEVLFI